MNLLLCCCVLLLVSCSAAHEPQPSAPAKAPTPAASPTGDARPSAAASSVSDASSSAAKAGASAPASVASVHELSAPTLEGETVALSKYKGRVLLVVNVASECGYTKQYAGLETLHETYAPRGFDVLGFPSNEFGGQEPGSAADIRAFCTSNYGVSFPLYAKLHTKPGADQAPLYAYLNAATGKLPNWNFCKYLIGKDGRAVAFYPSKVTPEDAELRAAIERELAR